MLAALKASVANVQNAEVKITKISTIVESKLQTSGNVSDFVAGSSALQAYTDGIASAAGVAAADIRVTSVTSARRRMTVAAQAGKVVIAYQVYTSPEKAALAMNVANFTAALKAALKGSTETIAVSAPSARTEVEYTIVVSTADSANVQAMIKPAGNTSSAITAQLVAEINNNLPADSKLKVSDFDGAVLKVTTVVAPAPGPAPVYSAPGPAPACSAPAPAPYYATAP